MGPIFSRQTSASGLPHSPGVLQCSAATTLAGLQEEEAAQLHNSVCETWRTSSGLFDQVHLAHHRPHAGQAHLRHPGDASRALSEFCEEHRWHLLPFPLPWASTSAWRTQDRTTTTHKASGAPHLPQSWNKLSRSKGGQSVCDRVDPWCAPSQSHGRAENQLWIWPPAERSAGALWERKPQDGLKPVQSHKDCLSH